MGNKKDPILSERQFLNKRTSSHRSDTEKKQLESRRILSAEEVLKQAEEKYRNIFENAMEGIFQITPKGRFLTVNPAMSRIYGYDSPQEMISDITSIEQQIYVKPKRRQEFKRILEKTGEIKGFETELCRKKGGTFWVSINAKAVKDKEGSILYYEGTSKEITEQKQIAEALRQSELRYRSLIESSPNAIVLHDGQRILYLNRAGKKLFGSENKKKQLLGRKILDFIHPGDREEISRDIDSIRQNGHTTPIKEVKLVRDDGRIVYIEYTGSSIDYGGPKLLQMIIRDITDRVRAEEAFNQIRYQQQAILDNIPDIAWLKNKESRFILANEPFGKACGIKPEDLAGKTDLDIWPRDLADKYRADDKAVMESGIRRQIEELLIDKDGNTMWIETIKTPVFNDRGEVIGTAGIARDITLKKQQKEQLQRNRTELEQLVEKRTVELMKVNALLEQELAEHERAEEALSITQFSVDRSADPIFWIGPDARFLYVNDITCKVLGYSRDEMLTMSVQDIDDNFPLHMWPRYWESLKKRGSITFESIHRTKGGMTIPVEITGNYLDYKGQEYNCVFARNISERKRSQEMVEKLNKELEWRIEELKTINKELETFNYSVSHDLRSPLIAIEGFSRILIEKQSHHLDAKGQHLLKLINKNTKKLNELILDLLDFFSLGRKNIKTVTVDMEKMVNDIVSDFKSMLPEDSFRVEFTALPAAQGDRKMIRQILINLMDNAIKYSRPRGTAFIKIGGWMEEERNIYFVKDYGIGFSMDQADRIFEVFERLHGADEFEGTGIGLAIVKRVVHKHGGDIWAEAKVGEGATFYFSLPERSLHNEG